MPRRVVGPDGVLSALRGAARDRRTGWHRRRHGRCSPQPGRRPHRHVLARRRAYRRAGRDRGALLSALYVLSDFGAVSLLRFDTFTRAIYTSYRASFDRTSAAVFALVLVILALIFILIERRFRGRQRRWRVGQARRDAAPGNSWGGGCRRSPRSSCSMASRWPSRGSAVAIAPDRFPSGIPASGCPRRSTPRRRRGGAALAMVLTVPVECSPPATATAGPAGWNPARSSVTRCRGGGGAVPGLPGTGGGARAVTRAFCFWGSLTPCCSCPTRSGPCGQPRNGCPHCWRTGRTQGISAPAIVVAGDAATDCAWPGCWCVARTLTAMKEPRPRSCCVRPGWTRSRRSCGPAPASVRVRGRGALRSDL